jgi:16S rRNA (guanine966-N2)-methyltransferase
MRLRIVSGSLGGRLLRCPEKQLSFRPTLERARKSLADMLRSRVAGSVVADLCAGSGAFGFEMLSNGADKVDFVENNDRCAALLREHAGTFGVGERCRVIVRDVAEFVRAGAERYNVIFFDPPYDAPGMPLLVPLMQRLLMPGGIVLYQRRRQTAAGENKAVPFETRAFGDTVIECHRGPE